MLKLKHNFDQENNFIRDIIIIIEMCFAIISNKIDRKLLKKNGPNYGIVLKRLKESRLPDN